MKLCTQIDRDAAKAKGVVINTAHISDEMPYQGSH